MSRFLKLSTQSKIAQNNISIDRIFATFPEFFSSWIFISELIMNLLDCETCVAQTLYSLTVNNIDHFYLLFSLLHLIGRYDIMWPFLTIFHVNLGSSVSPKFWSLNCLFTNNGQPKSEKFFLYSNTGITPRAIQYCVFAGKSSSSSNLGFITACPNQGCVINNTSL